MDTITLLALMPEIVRGLHAYQQLVGAETDNDYDEAIAAISQVALEAFEKHYGRDVVDNAKVETAVRALVDVWQDVWAKRVLPRQL